MVKSRDLPLHYFDLLFRTFGAGLLFILWAIRAVVTYSWPKAFPRKRDTVVKPFTLDFVLSAIRGAMYQLHVGGACVCGGMYDCRCCKCAGLSWGLRCPESLGIEACNEHLCTLAQGALP